MREYFLTKSTGLDVKSFEMAYVIIPKANSFQPTLVTRGFFLACGRRKYFVSFQWQKHNRDMTNTRNSAKEPLAPKVFSARFHVCNTWSKSNDFIIFKIRIILHMTQGSRDGGYSTETLNMDILCPQRKHNTPRINRQHFIGKHLHESDK